MLGFFAGNFYRIRSAFKYGARKLGWILLLPGERIADELKKFFGNTLERHGSNCWADLQNSACGSEFRVPDHLLSASGPESVSEEKKVVGSTVGCKIQGSDAVSGIGQMPDSHILQAVSPHVVLDYGCGLDKDIEEDATFRILRTENTNGPTNLLLNGNHLSTSVPVSSHQSHQCCSLDSCREKDKNESVLFPEKLAASSAIDGKNFTSKLETNGKHSTNSNLASSCINCTDSEFIGSSILCDVTYVQENTNHMENDTPSISGRSKTLNSLLDLKGDHESHFRNLQYGQFSQGYAMSPPVLLSPPLSPQLSNKNPWESIHKSLQFPHSVNSRSDRNCVAFGPQFYPTNHCSLPGALFVEENKTPRGTGTYIPIAVQ